MEMEKSLNKHMGTCTKSGLSGLSRSRAGLPGPGQTVTEDRPSSRSHVAQLAAGSAHRRGHSTHPKRHMARSGKRVHVRHGMRHDRR
jgi:hypothetical protein